MFQNAMLIMCNMHDYNNDLTFIGVIIANLKQVFLL